MFPSEQKTDYILSGARGGAPLPGDAAWDVLDRFLRELPGCERTADQIRLTLEIVRDATGAEAVYWYPGGTGESLQVLGSSLSAEWCQFFAQRMLEATPGVGSQLLLPTVTGGPTLLPHSPRSAALVRVSKSKGAWLVALRFQGDRPFGISDIKVMTLAKRILLAHRQQVRVYDKLKDTLFGLVRCLTTAIDAKDPFTYGHSERVARIAVRLGQEMRLPGALLSDVYLAGLLHDIGKIGIRERILQKPDKLTPEEERQVREHPVLGECIMASIKQLEHLRPAVRHHHERWDGKGYPDGLAGERIPLLARLLAVADGCDAMMAARPYRAAMPTERIDAVLAEGAGSQWDPRIVEHFMACRNELYPICQQGIGDSLLFRAVREAAEAGPEEGAATPRVPESWQATDGAPAPV